MKIIRNILVVLLMGVLFSTSAFATGHDGFNAGIVVDRSVEGQMSVTVEDSSILADKRPTLSIPCDYDYAKVSAPDAESTVEYCTIADGEVTFTVFIGGTYVIEKIDSLPSEGGEEGEGGTVTPPPGGGTVTPPAVDEPESDKPCDGSENCAAHPFTDVDAALWYHEAIDYAIEQGLMNGVDGGKFDPLGNMSRAMMWTMLARKAGVDSTPAAGDLWYAEGYKWAVANGISDGSNPDMDITREQMITMLWNYEGKPASSYDLSSFADEEEISPWCVEAMRWAVETGVVSGQDGNKLAPGTTAMRSEVAQIFLNYFGK